MAEKTFNQEGDFGAFRAAEAFLKERGFSVGRPQRGDPIGVMFGDYDIQKWRNLDNRDRAELHGTITGDKRNGPVTITIFDGAPDEARQAFTA